MPPPPRSTDHDFDDDTERTSDAAVHPPEHDDLDYAPTLRAHPPEHDVLDYAPALRAHPAEHNDLDYAPTIRGLRAGLKVFGMRYTLVRQIGRGGMGVVWLARDRNLDLDVALKFLPNALVHDDESIADLKRETRKCRQLTHPNIVRVHDLVEGSDNNTAAIAMEYVEGKTLQALKREQPQRCFSTTQITPWLQTMVQALTYAHESVRIVHRDLKPANLMLNSAGELKILDFGIAHNLSDTLSHMTQGGVGVTGGTLLYMSPQQLMGSPPSVTDDMYALGVTLYELLTGKPPFYSGSIEQQIERVVPPSMAQRLHEFGITGPTAIPLVWEQMVAACLEKDARKRPQSAREVWIRLNQAPPPPPKTSTVVGPMFAGEASARRTKLSAAGGKRETTVFLRKRAQPALSPALHKAAIITCILSVFVIGTTLEWRYAGERQQERALEASRAAEETRLKKVASDALQPSPVPLMPEKAE